MDYASWPVRELCDMGCGTMQVGSSTWACYVRDITGVIQMCVEVSLLVYMREGGSSLTALKGLYSGRFFLPVC